VRFRVERVLREGDGSTPEGKDRILAQLRPIFETMPPSAVRLDLERLVASTLALPESLMQTLLADRGGRSSQRDRPSRERDLGAEDRRRREHEGASRRSREDAPETQERGSRRSGTLARRRQAELAFLSLCLAAPELGAQALAAIQPEAHFSDRVLQRIAEHLRGGDLRNPVAGTEEWSPEARRMLAEIVVEAGRGPVNEAMLKVSSLQLELGRIDRMIQAARVGGGDATVDSDAESGAVVSELAKRRAQVKRDFDAAQELALQRSGA
jgi:DNA primase